MRLFTGISPAPAVLENIRTAVVELSAVARLKWSPVENLHITTKFIGAWEEDRLPELESALRRVTTAGKISLSVAQFGFFPNARQPRVFFAGVQAGPGLERLASAIDDALEPLGCAREEQPYRPHVTLAKIGREADDLQALRAEIAAMPTPEFGAFEADAFHLYLSKPGSGGSVYTPLSSYGLR